MILILAITSLVFGGVFYRTGSTETKVGSPRIGKFFFYVSAFWFGLSLVLFLTKALQLHGII